LWAVSAWLVRDKAPIAWPGRNRFLQRLEFLNLGHSHSLHLVKVGEEKVLLLAVSPKGTDTILSTSPSELTPLPLTEDPEGKLVLQLREIFAKKGADK
jgi:flagellar biogenesis protein FliO